MIEFYLDEITLLYTICPTYSIRISSYTNVCIRSVIKGISHNINDEIDSNAKLLQRIKDILYDIEKRIC